MALAYNHEADMTLERATGPIIDSVTYSDGGKTATVKFRNVGDGLKTVDGASEVKGFLGLSATNRPTLTVTATITGKDIVTVKCDKAMSGVAYNAVSANYFGVDINLANSYDCPAGAFMLNKD